VNHLKKWLTSITTVTLILSSFVAEAMADSPGPITVQNGSTVLAPTVVGPILSTVKPGNPSHDYTWLATNEDLGKFGYIEEEFFVDGVARQYSIPATLGTGEEISSGWPYKTRIVVRRPISSQNFSGKVLLEWNNVTAGVDIDFNWLGSYSYIMRSGHAYVSVSTQRVGVNALKAWSPVRYGSLDVTAGGKFSADELSFDIYSQVAKVLRNPGEVSPLGSLKVKQILATGPSQSGRYLANYHNAIHPLHQVVDGFAIVVSETPLRKDLDVKTMRILTETDVRLKNSEADTDHFRRWETAGTSHVGWVDRIKYEPLLLRDLGSVSPVVTDRPPFSRIAFNYVVNAAYEHLFKWIEGGEAPPVAPRLDWLSDTIKARDVYGNALGGIRLPEHQVPTAVNTGENSGSGFARLYGSHEPFDANTLKLLYPNHGSYISAINQATNSVIKQGFLLKEDAQVTRETAAQSNVGK
jgi:hypothetical protein